MRLHEIFGYPDELPDTLSEHGRIVKNVNTTVDVDLDEIPRQASKWGWDLDIDGRPPLIYDMKKRS